MCILFLSYEPQCMQSSSCQPYLLMAASNRDEYYNRSTLPAGFWEDHPHVLAGRDVHRSPKGGTWLGITKDGRFSALTNYCTPVAKRNTPSKGGLVSGFLLEDSSPHNYCVDVLQQGSKYNGFNLLTAVLSSPGESELAYCTNMEDTPVKSLGAGIYGLSNQLLDSPWKKVVHGKNRFSRVVSKSDLALMGTDVLTQQLMDVLSSTTCFFPDNNFPDYGYSDNVMKCLSSVFVRRFEWSSKRLYGTRTQTVVLVSKTGQVTFTERTIRNPATTSASSDCSGMETLNWQTRTFNFPITPF